MSDPFTDDATATTDFFGTPGLDQPMTPTEHAYANDEPKRHAEVMELADFYRHLADSEFDGYCDIYAELARAIATDHDMLERVASMAPATKIIPVLLFAAVHDRVLQDPTLALAALYRGASGDPWPAFRAFVNEHFDKLQKVVRSRTIQTNEVGRSAVIRPALTAVHRYFDRPLAVIELGPSAGLNLYFDRFGYEYTLPSIEASQASSVTEDSDTTVATTPSSEPVASTRRVGDRSSAVQLTCDVRGDLVPPLDQGAPIIATRTGIDINPIDVLDADACRWLEACIWPLIPQRADRFRAAVDLARTDPPTLHTGTALECLAPLVESLSPDLVPVIISTWVLAYFTKPERIELGELLDQLGSTRDLAAVTAEYPGVAPWIPRPDREAHDNAGQAGTCVGLLTWRNQIRQARPLAWTHAHGRWIDWLDADTAEGPIANRPASNR